MAREALLFEIHAIGIGYPAFDKRRWKTCQQFNMKIVSLRA